MATLTRIVIADDHQLTRKAVRAIIAGEPEVEIVGEAADGDAALELARAEKPDILLVDLHMKGTPTLATVRELAASEPRIRIIVLTAYEFPHLVAELLEAGIAGYVLKDDASEELLPAVRAVIAGRRYHSRSLTPRSKALFQPAEPPPPA